MVTVLLAVVRYVDRLQLEDIHIKPRERQEEDISQSLEGPYSNRLSLKGPLTTWEDPG